MTEKKKSPKSLREKSNFLLDFTHSWITPFIYDGIFKKFTISDVPELPSSFKNENLLRSFDKHYKKFGKIKKSRLLLSLLLFFFKPLLFSQVLHAVYLLIILTIPYVQKLLLEHIFASETTPKILTYQSSGVVLCAILAILELILTMVNKYKFEYCSEMFFKIQSILYGKLYERVLSLEFGELDEKKKQKFFNFITFEIDQVSVVVFSFQAIWEMPILILFSAILMFLNLSYPSFVAIGVVVCILPMFFIISYITTLNFVKVMNVNGENTSMLSKIFSGIKQIKFNVWEEIFLKKILKMKRKLLFHIYKYLISNLLLQSLNVLTSMIVETCVFALCLSFKKSELTIQSIFPSISYIKTFSSTVTLFPINLQNFSKAIICFHRIEKILTGKELTEIQPKKKKLESSFRLKHTIFKWVKHSSSRCDKGTRLDLSNLDLRIEKGSLVGVVGKVCSGKSSFLHSLVGNMEVESGEVMINGKISFCPQTPFILNESFKENILFGKKMCEKKFFSIIDCCDFNEDLKCFNDGIFTEIGEKGSTISGGQRMRISICRTLYNESEIYLFDDVFNTVNPRISNFIFKKAILGMLKDKTRIIVTNEKKFLKRCDYILCFEEMQIAEHGEYSDLIQKENGIFQNLMKKFNSTFSSSSISEGESRNKTTVLERNANSKDEVEKLIKDEDIGGGYIHPKTILFYISSFGICQEFGVLGGLVISFILCLIYLIVYVCSKFPEMWISLWVSNSTDFGDFVFLMVFIVAGITLPVVFFIFISISSFFSIFSSYKIYKRLVKNFFYTKMRFYYRNSLGRILNVLSGDIISIHFILLSVITFFSSVTELFVILGGIITTNLYCIITIVLLIFFYFLFQEFYRKVNRQLVRLDKSSLSNLISFFEQSIVGNEVIKNCSAQNFFKRKFAANVDDRLKIKYHDTHITIWKNFKLGILNFVFVFFTCLIIALLSRYSVGVSLLTGFSLTNFLVLLPSLKNFVLSIVYSEKLFVSVERVFHYTNIVEPEENLEKIPIDFFNEDKNNSIKFKNVSLRYRENTPVVLKDINFKIESNEKVGIVGRTGCGKSSILECLLRSENVETGKIFVGKKNIYDFPLKSLRRKISILTQNPGIFLETIRFNIDPYKKFSDDKIWSALEKCSLKEYVDTLPLKLQTKIKSESLFSRGQIQLLNLTRIFLENPKILCVDECTSNLDFETSEFFYETLFGLFKKTTIMVVTHKINAVLSMNRIFVMKKGKIVERGNTKKLLKKSDSILNTMLKELNVLKNE